MEPTVEATQIASRSDDSAEERLLVELAQSIGGVSALGRLAALGQLNGGVVHDLNNLLAVTLGYANLLMAADLERGSEPWKRALEIRNAAVRAQALIRELLDGEAARGDGTATADTGNVLEGIRGLLHQIAGPDIDLSIEVGAGSPQVAIAARDLERTLLNLTLNSQEAMPNGGELKITVKGLLLEGNDLAGYRQPQRGELSPGPYALLTVADTGCGLDEETCRQVLQPYFTTRRDRGGKGLGLATVANLVTGVSGAMSISSSPGGGTTVYLWLPSARQ